MCAVSVPGPPLINVSASSSCAKNVSLPSLPLKVSRPGPPVSVSSSLPRGHEVVSGPAIEDIVALLGVQQVVPRTAVDRVRRRSATQEVVVALAARDHVGPGEVQAGSAGTASVEVIVAAEKVHLEIEGVRREREVDVAVAARREAALARGHEVVAFRAVDDDPVGSGPERGRDLDLRGVDLRRRTRGRRHRLAGRGSASRS